MQFTQQPCFSKKMSGEHTAVMAWAAFIPHAFLGRLAEISPPELVGSTYTGEHSCISMGHTQAQRLPRKHTSHEARAPNPPSRTLQAHGRKSSGKGTSVNKLTDVSSSITPDRCGTQESCLWVTAHQSQVGWGADPVLTTSNSYSKSQPKDGLSNILGPVCGESFLSSDYTASASHLLMMVSRAT